MSDQQTRAELLRDIKLRLSRLGALDSEIIDRLELTSTDVLREIAEPELEAEILDALGHRPS